MITIYDAKAENFANLGLGALAPTECKVTWEEGGRYDLTLKQPILDDGKWMMIGDDRIIRAPSPVRESPYVEQTAGSSVSQTVTRRIYRVKTPKGGRLNLRKSASTNSKILASYKPGKEVIAVETSGNWTRVIVIEGGKAGWMYTDYLQYVRDETETVASGDKPGTVIKRRQAGDQLFRITDYESDDANGLVLVNAEHISYDLGRVVVIGKCDLEKVPVATALAKVQELASREHDFEIHCLVTGNVTGDYTNKSLLECIRDPKIGFAPQLGARVVCDNFDVWILPDEVRDLGVVLRYRKNLLGVKMKTDTSSRVSRIYPVGEDEDGEPLYLDGTKYVESAAAADMVERDTVIKYDVKVGDGEDEFADKKTARAELKRLAAEDMEAGADAKLVSLDVNFLDLGDTEEYERYKHLEVVHPYDTVTVIRGNFGIKEKARLNKCVMNGLTKKYESTTFGAVQSETTTMYSFNIASGAVKNSQIAAGAVGAAQLRSASIQYAKIAQAAIEQLSANAITALRAHINELVAGSVTTDQLYADLAVIAAAQITAANIDNANIDWAEIATLNAQIAEIAEATITTADIKWAEIATLNAQIASIAQAKIDNAEITSAQITDLEATVASIFSAKIGSADIGFAQIKDLVTQQAIITEGVGGQLYMARLAVTEANMVSLTVGELIVKGSDGRFYSFSVDESGNVTTELKEISNDDVADASIHGTQKLIEGSITAQVLNVEEIFADSAIIRQMIAANIDVATLFAREATIDQLNALDIRGNESLRLLVGGKNTVYRQETQPEDAAANDLWIQPSTGYTWQYTAAEALPEMYLDDDGSLVYAYADGEAGPEYILDDDGNLLYSGEGGQTIGADGELVNTLWVRVKDADLSAAELKLTDEGIMGVVTGTQAWQDVQSAAEVTESQIAVLESQFTQRMDGFELSIEKSVGRDELRTYIRYEDGAAELGSSASRYTAQISDKGFVVLQDGEAMTSMVQNTVSAPVIEARRQFQLGGFALRIGADGHLLLA